MVSTSMPRLCPAAPPPNRRAWSGLRVGLVPVGYVGHEGRIVVVFDALGQVVYGRRSVHDLVLGHDVADAVVHHVSRFEAFGTHNGIIPYHDPAQTPGRVNDGSTPTDIDPLAPPVE